MRKLIWILAVLLILSCAAQAEENYAAQKDDLYYHINTNCGGAKDMAPISAEGAREFGKYPCPICMPDDTKWKSGIAAIARGNTIIVRFADAYLAKPELTGVFCFSVPNTAPLDEAPAFLAEYLHGDAYNDYLRDLQSGSAETIARVPCVLRINQKDQNVLIMNRRHIGNAWLIALRPDEKIGDSWDMYWRINGLVIKPQNGDIDVSFDLQTLEAVYTLAVPQFSDPAAYSAQFDRMRIDVFADAGKDVRANVAVITQFDADPDCMENSTLCIGDRVRIPIDGYMDDENGIFCCTLTDAEYAYLADGARATVQPPDDMESAGF